MSERPDREQLRVIKAADTQAILLHAGPGSGKTRTLIGRISYLLKAGHATSEQIVAVTFTNKAAHELHERIFKLLDEEITSDLIVGTFHSLAHRILREYADVAGVHPRFTVCDEPLQETMMRRALVRAGLSQYAEKFLIYDILEAFSFCKRERHNPADCPGTHPLPQKARALHSLLPQIAEYYHDLLHQHAMLDFDDLILYASQVLYDSTIGTVWRQARPWLFVDEFHDIDRAQYQFVQLLAPPDDCRVMAVLDDEQRIYGWRGAEAAILEQFRREYRPREYHLHNNYRSGTRIVEVCDSLLQSGGVRRASHCATANEGSVISHWSAHEAEEGGWLAEEIKRLQHEQGHKLDDIALLYRTHKVGEYLEQVLVEHGFALERIRRRSFFDQPEAQELRRYLQSAISIADEVMAAALNFPRVVADELTMIQLRRVAAERGVSLADLMQSVQECEELGPATCRQVSEFLQLVQDELAPFVQEPLRSFNDRLFNVLERRRSPYPQEGLETLRGLVAFLDLSHLVEPICHAIEERRPFQFVVADTADGWCAAALLADVLVGYFNLPTHIVTHSHDAPALQMRYGELDAATVQLDVWNAGSIQYPATLIAWQLAASLLLRFERASDAEVVAFDLETTGLNRYKDSVVELAAQRLRGFRAADEGFEQLVNPGCPISRQASEMHGIFPEDVRHAPSWRQVLPDYLAYLGDQILIGHNAAKFDLPFLRTGLGQMKVYTCGTPHLVVF